MPDWFMTLAYIFLTVMMICFFIGFSGFILYVAFISARDWKDYHDFKRRFRQRKGGDT